MTTRPWPLSCTAELVLSRPDSTEVAVRKLKAFRDKCALPSFDPWTNMALLRLQDIEITRPLLQILVGFLNLPFAKDPTGNRPGRNKRFRWIQLEMIDVDFYYVYYHNPANKQHCCTDRDIQRLSSAIAHRPLILKFTRSYDIVSRLAPQMAHSSGVQLTIVQRKDHWLVKYGRLGAIIQRSVQLRELELSLPFTFGAHALFERLGDAINLETLSLERNFIQAKRYTDSLIGSNDPWILILQHPHNRLKKLSLCFLGLEDQHLIAISQLLPTSQIVYFKFHEQEVKAGGILEFAHQLPRIHTLESVGIGSFEGLSEITRSQISAALLQGVMENTSLHTMCVSCDASLLPRFQYYLVLNRAGRRILTSSQPIPDGLWPFILERVWNARSHYEMCCGEVIHSMSEKTTAYDAVFFLLQNGPRI